MNVQPIKKKVIVSSFSVIVRLCEKLIRKIFKKEKDFSTLLIINIDV